MTGWESTVFLIVNGVLILFLSGLAWIALNAALDEGHASDVER